MSFAGGSNTAPASGYCPSSALYPLPYACDNTASDGIKRWSDYARSLGFTIFVVAVGSNINTNEISLLAGMDTNKMYAVSSYAKLDLIVGTLVSATCSEPANVNTSTVITSSVAPDSSLCVKYRDVVKPFDFFIRFNSSSSNITAYLSYSVPSKYPAQHGPLAQQ